MILIGPLIGLVCALGIAGLVAGRFLGNAILRRAVHPARVGRIVAWSWACTLAVAGIGLAVAVVATGPPDPLSPAVAAFYLWMFGVNAITGSLAIRARAGREPAGF